MKPAPFPHPQSKPLILTPKDEAILQAFATYRFLTSQEIIALFYKKGSKTYVRSRLSALCGAQDITDKDFTEGYPLLRFGFPTGRLGNQERIFCVSATGRQILAGLGIPVSFHLKVAKLRTFSHSFLLHDLTRNRFVVSLTAWAKGKPNLSVQTHLSYQFAKNPTHVEIPVQRPVLSEGKMVKVSVREKVPVIWDALILITDTNNGNRRLLLLEIDQNTQAASRFKQHIASRLAYVSSPTFTNTYTNIPYRIVYATHAVTPSAAQARLQTMLEHTMNALTERKREQDSRHFRFTTINFSTLYEDAQALFETPAWYCPDDPKTPIPLLTG